MRAQASLPSRQMPAPPHRARKSGMTPWELAYETVAQDLAQYGAAFSASATAEDIGVPPDMVRRLAALAMVQRDMVALGLLDFEDAIRIGSEGLAASLRLSGKDHGNPDAPATVHPRFAQASALRRSAIDAPDTRHVAAPRTSCPRCGTRSDWGCVHQHVEIAE